MRGDMEFRWVYRRDRYKPVAQYRYEYYTVKRYGAWGMCKKYETIKGKWIDMSDRDAAYIPLIKAMQKW